MAPSRVNPTTLTMLCRPRPIMRVDPIFYDVHKMGLSRRTWVDNSDSCVLSWRRGRGCRGVIWSRLECLEDACAVGAPCTVG